MIWIVLVLGLLFVAMSCVALWYREKWGRVSRELEELQQDFPARGKDGRFCKRSK